MIFFWKIVPNWVYFGQGEDVKLNTEMFEKSAIFPQPGNQKGLSEGILLMSINEVLLSKTKLCAFQVTKI